MHIIIISGPSAAGKTTVSKIITRELGYRECSKDAIKERLFKASPRSTHRFIWYENHARETFYQEIKSNLLAHKSLVIESNFTKRDRKILASLVNKNMQISEIHCTAKGFIRFKRFLQRTRSGIRHPGHHDRKWYVSMFLECLISYSPITWPYIPMNLSESLYVLDTSDFTKVDYDEVIRFIKE
jgi:predicted kinase